MPARMLKPGRHGGAFVCAACALPEDKRDQLNGELAKRVPLLRLEKRWGISRTALRAHRANHFPKALIALRAERISNGVRKVADRQEELIVETQKMYEAAKKVAHMPLALKAVREQRSNYELLARITGELDDRPEVTINVQQSTEYIMVRNIFFEEAEAYPELRARISRRLRVLAETGTDPGS